MLISLWSQPLPLTDCQHLLRFVVVLHGQQRYVSSGADSSSVLSVKDFNASYSETRKMESASTICALPSIEEAEKE
ncbi:hypothetical protein TELCIR_19929, partial [Teladorsagia circumcincta]